MSDTDKRSVSGTIFNIQFYSVNDGPGIRSIVFLKGCPLKCLWCHNPESRSIHPDLMFYKESCTGCGRCIPACPEKAISIGNGLAVTDRTLCVNCGRCVSICPNEARRMSGYTITAGEVVKKIKGDMPFYKRSGGGVTLSGGEVLAQAEFAAAIADICHEEGINVAIETCGAASWDIARDLLCKADILLYDIKQMDDDLHKKYTGVSNKQILENLKKLHNDCGKKVVVRIPVIPGYNDDIGNIRAAAKFVAEELGNDVSIDLLPYHNLGEIKNERLGIDCEIKNLKPPATDYMEELRLAAESFGLSAKIN